MAEWGLSTTARRGSDRDVKRDADVRAKLDGERRASAAKTDRLRALRLAKEATEAAEVAAVAAAKEAAKPKPKVKAVKPVKVKATAKAKA